MPGRRGLTISSSSSMSSSSCSLTRSSLYFSMTSTAMSFFSSSVKLPLVGREPRRGTVRARGFEVRICPRACQEENLIYLAPYR